MTHRNTTCWTFPTAPVTLGATERTPTRISTTKGCTRHVQTSRRASAEVSHLSKGEICSNYSLTIYPYISTTIHSPTRDELRSTSGFTALSDGWTLVVYNISLGSRMGTSPPCGDLSGARPWRFLAWMVGAPGSPALALSGGSPSTFLSVDGERSRITSSDTSRGSTVDVS
jgi:hypothetical protein